MKISKFQIIVIGLFVIFTIIGVIAFATFRGSGGGSDQLPPISIWGTFPKATFDDYVSKVNQTLASSITINYTQKNQSAFSQEFISALARGQGPDVILIPADTLLPHLDKISYIPYDALDQRTFRDSYIQEGEIYLGSDGTSALPFLVDPLIMYWNRDVFGASGIATYPKYWDEFGDLAKKLTVIDENSNLRKSAVALGDFANVSNAREVLGTLIMQLGNPITRVEGQSIQSTLGDEPRPDSAVQFFAQFANPNHPNYSWNRGMPESKTAFLSGTLATYFGFVSEISDLRGKNPNLNFDAALIPQVRPSNPPNANIKKVTYGRMYGFSILKSSANQNAAFQIISLLTDPSNLPQLEQTMYIPSVRRDIIARGSKDAYITIFNQAALVAKTWLDADPVQSGRILRTMVSAVTSGASSVQDAIDDADDEYDVALSRALQ